MKSFRKKMMCILLFFALVPLTVATIYSYCTTRKYLYEKMNLSAMTYVEQMAKGVDNELQHLISNMDLVISSKEFQHAMNRYHTSQTAGELYLMLQEMDKLLIGVFGRQEGVSGIYVTMPDGKTFSIKDEYSTDLEKFSQNEWFVGKDTNFSAIVSRGIVTMENGERAMIFGKLVRDVSDVANLAEIGSVHFAIDVSIFDDVIIENEEESVLFLLDNESQLLVKQCESERADTYLRAIREFAL